MSTPVGRIPKTLDLCRGCRQYVIPSTVICPHCGGDIAKLEHRYREFLALAHAAQAKLEQLLNGTGDSF